MRKPALFAALASVLMLVGACDNESHDTGRPGDFSPATSTGLNVAEDCEWSPTPPEIIDTLDWEVFEGSLQPGSAGFLIAQPATWGPGCTFMIQVPPGAVTGGPEDPRVDFSIAFPTKESYLANQSENCGNGLPLIMDLEPSGLLFTERVTVYATYMPWTDVTAQDILSESWWDSSPFGEHELLWVQEKKGVVTFAFKVDHFSRWAVGAPDPPIPPGGFSELFPR